MSKVAIPLIASIASFLATSAFAFTVWSENERSFLGKCASGDTLVGSKPYGSDKEYEVVTEKGRIGTSLTSRDEAIRQACNE
jgi:hypothetical protein